jgi:shikimate dehydrogenase
LIRGALLGSPVSHSLGPVLHNAAFAYLGIEGKYQAIDVPSGNLRDFLLEEGDNFDYFSVTMPLKEEVLDLGLKADAHTLKIQSGNTLYKRSDQWNLTSTDGNGLISALKNAGLSRFDNVLILGTGGTARAAAGALDLISQEIHVLGRSGIRQKGIERCINSAQYQYLQWGKDIKFGNYDLVLNATPAGATDILANSAQKGLSGTLFDANYKPWPSAIAERWSSAGGQVISGLELLLYQGIDALALVLNEEFNRFELASHLRLVLSQSI